MRELNERLAVREDDSFWDLLETGPTRFQASP